MKTHVIQLEAYDDIYSARDKMAWNTSEQILVMVPAENHYLNRKLDLVLLNRQAKAQGAKLGITTQDQNIAFYARQIGIPVFETPFPPNPESGEIRGKGITSWKNQNPMNGLWSKFVKMLRKYVYLNSRFHG